jgi:hypothetical protein
MVRVDKNKKKLYENYSKIAVGDIVFDGCDGPCSGGALYGIGDRVIKVTKTKIITENHSFYRKNGVAASPPTAYYIEFWQKERRK